MGSASPFPISLFIRLNRNEKKILKDDHSIKCEKCALKNRECQPCNYWETADGSDGYYVFKTYNR